MPISDPRMNLQRTKVAVFNPTAMGSAAAIGQRVNIASPVRGVLEEVGFVPNSLVASTSTIAVSVNPFNTAPTASNFTQVVTSTLGTFTSQQLFEGSIASVTVPTGTNLNPGDVLQITTSGNLAAIGAEIYAIIRRG